jgi:hypothetical protein
MEEELRLDLGPALEAIRGELTRALEEVPRSFRDAFGDALVGIVQDFGAAAELARAEMERVVSAPLEVGPVDIPVVVDTTAIDAVPGEVASAAAQSGNIDINVPVDVDAHELADVEETIRGLDGETINVDTSVDSGPIEAATQATDELGNAANAAQGQIRAAGAQIASIASGVADLNDIGFGRGALAALTTVIFGFGASAIDADAKLRSFNTRVGDLAETLQRVDVAGLNTDLSELAIKIGADDDSLRLALATFVSLGEGSGRSRKEIGQLGQELTALSAYLSVTNPALGTAEDIANRLPTALARGGRALAPFGIALNTAAVNARALNDSGKDTVEQLTIFDRAAAGLAITVEDLGDKLKSGLDEGLQTPAVRLRAIKVAVQETIESLGGQFIQPILDITEEIGPALEHVAQAVAGAASSFADILVPTFQVLGPLVSGLAQAFDALPDSMVAAGAAGYVAFKAFQGLQGALEALRIAEAEEAAIAEAAAARRLVTGNALAAQQVAVAAATQARIAAEAELVAAEAALTVAEGDRLALQGDLVAAELGVVVAAQAEAAAMVELASAEDVAAAATLELEATFPPLLIAAAAFAAVMAVLTLKADKLKVSIHDTAAVTNAELVKAFDDLTAFGQGKSFMEQLAEQSLPAANQLRDALQAQGRDVTELSRIIDTAAQHEREATRDKTASAEETKKLTAALSAGEPVAAIAAAHALEQSLAYDALSQETKDLITALLEMEGVNERVAKSAKDSADQVAAQAKAANDAEDAFTAATSALSAYLGLAEDQLGQGLKFSIVLDDLTKKQDDFTKSKGKTGPMYAIETAEGRKNIDMLVGIVEQQQKIAANNVKTDDPQSIGRATAKYREQVDALRAVATQTGTTAAQFDDLLKFYGLLPEQLETAISITKVDEAKADVNKFRDDIEKLPIELRITTTLNASEEYQAIVRALAAFGPIPVSARVDPGQIAGEIGSRLAVGGVLESVRFAAGGVAEPVGVAAYASGGIREVERYAQGEDHTAQIATGLRIFAEPETGGEAYIPLSPAKRARSTEILEDVAKRFGLEVVPGAATAARFAEGGVTGPAWDDAPLVDVLSALTDVLRTDRATVDDLGARPGEVAAAPAVGGWDDTAILEALAGLTDTVRANNDVIGADVARYAGGDVVAAQSSWDDSAMLAALAQLTEVVRTVPDRIPGGVTANIELTQEEHDTLARLGDRLRSASGRR